MKPIKVDGTNRVYIMDNGDTVPFDEMNEYIEKHKSSSPKIVTQKVKKRRTRKKKEN
jgi:hypothetical protein